MQITRFFGTDIHGYLNFDVQFNAGLTFLTGINGSGKTSVIQSIIALISPSFFVLANLNFKTIRVELIHDDRPLTIEAHHLKNEAVEITTSATNKALVIKHFSPDPDDPPFRGNEKEQDYYRELLVSLATHDVVKIINKLPTPMFLDLDRRARALLERREGRPVRLTRRFTRNIFAASLAQSMDMATGLAEAQYRDSLIAIGRFGEELRKKMILDLLELETASAYGESISIPTSAELDTVNSMRKSVETLPHILQLPKEEIDRRLVPTLETLEQLARAIPKSEDITEFLRDKGPTDPGFQALLNWNANRSQLQKLVRMVDHVKDFNARRTRQIEQALGFLKITNSFLGDSGKELFFDENGYLWFRVDGQSENRPTSSLSSGEGQLFVIISHLYFNPLAREANVFIIDEPELSLHVQWQELFVQSVMTANPNIQYIMATHSPSIILDRVSDCRDLSKANENGFRG